MADRLISAASDRAKPNLGSTAWIVVALCVVAFSSGNSTLQSRWRPDRSCDGRDRTRFSNDGAGGFAYFPISLPHRSGAAGRRTAPTFAEKSDAA